MHADETGWRLSGHTVWLWCFSTARASYYLIDRSRGSPALSKFFTTVFEGILITDFWSAYRAVDCTGQQTCLAHLFRELKKTEERNQSPEWLTFAKLLKRLLRDGIRLHKRFDGLGALACLRLRIKLDFRLQSLLDTPWRDHDVCRIVKRLRRYQETIFTFLDYPDVPWTNNQAEREIRPVVIMRKNSYTNRSENGAQTQAILMSVYRTLNLRGYNPLATIITALRTYARTGKMPPLPQ